MQFGVKSMCDDAFLIVTFPQIQSLVVDFYYLLPMIIIKYVMCVLHNLIGSN